MHMFVRSQYQGFPKRSACLLVTLILSIFVCALPRTALAGGGFEEDNYGNKWYEPGYNSWKNAGKDLLSFYGPFNEATGRYESDDITVLRIPTAVSPGYSAHGTAWMPDMVEAIGLADESYYNSYYDNRSGLSDAELAEYYAEANNTELSLRNGRQIETEAGKHSINCAIFKRVPNLKVLYIPKSILHIGRYVFYGCNNLTDIWFGGTKAEWDEAVGGRDLRLDSSVKIHYESAEANDINSVRLIGEHVPNPDSFVRQPVYYYDGTAKEPGVTVMFGNNSLVEGRDYTLRYEDNVDAGSYSDDAPCVVLTGKGAYSGSLRAYFIIEPVDISTVDGIPRGIPEVTAGVPLRIPDELPFSLSYRGMDLVYRNIGIYSGKQDYDLYMVSGGGYVGQQFGQEYDVIGGLTEGRHELEVWGFGNYTGEVTIPFIVVAGSPLKDGWSDLAGVGKVYSVGSSLVTGWMDLGSAKYYFQPDGSMSVGWTDVEVDGKEMHYYFNPASGNLVRDTWFTIGEATYYFRPSGNLATGWATIKDAGVDKKYYFEPDGTLVRDTWYDVVNDEGVTNHYYFRPSGAMATGWATIDGRQYFFRPSGNMATGWADVTNDNGVTAKHYFDEGGVMLTGWQDIGPNRYYFRPSGAMQTGEATIDGRAYRFTDKGVLIQESQFVAVEPDLEKIVAVG